MIIRYQIYSNDYVVWYRKWKAIDSLIDLNIIDELIVR